MFIMFAINVQASEPFTKTDTVLQTISQASLVIDWGQTLDIKNHEWMYERNPILGKHPSDSKINAYFVGAIIGNQLMAQYLEGNNRRIWQVAIIAIQTITITENHQLGLSVNFQF